jgi:hypothetical protein
MSFARVDSPSPDTHIPIKVEIPNESNDVAVGRPDMPPPSLWQRSVKVVRKLDGKEAVVHRIDWSTMMFRAYYPDEINRETGEKGRHADRTEWEHCRDWNVSVTFSPAELERQAARKMLDDEIAKMDARNLALAKVLCDDDDPNKALAKLKLLVESGLIKQMSDDAAKAIVDSKIDVPPEPAKRVIKKPEEKP